MWLILHILGKADRSMSCYPSNKTLCEDTGWDIKKLQRVKDELIKRGILTVTARAKEGRQSSNLYTIESDLLGIYIPAKNVFLEDTPKEDTLKEDTTPYPKMGQRSINQKEVLDTADSKESASQETLFDLSPEEGNTEKKEKKKNARAKEKQPEVILVKCENCGGTGKISDGQYSDDCARCYGSGQMTLEKHLTGDGYKDFVKIWTEAYPELGFNALSGRKIKSLISTAKAILRENNKEDTVEAAAYQFQYVLAYMKRTGHWLHGKSITVVDSKYREIYFEIKNGKPRTAKKESASDYIARKFA